MSMGFSRRQSLKMMAGAGLLSALPLGAISASEAKHAFIITSQDDSVDVFAQQINESMDSSAIQVNLKRHESFLSIADLPKGALLIGLVNEAEKVLIDALVQNRRGIIKTTARVGVDSSDVIIPELAEMTVKSALAFTSDNFNEFQNRELSTGPLISFYAYL